MSLDSSSLVNKQVGVDGGDCLGCSGEDGGDDVEDGSAPFIFSVLDFKLDGEEDYMFLKQILHSTGKESSKQYFRSKTMITPNLFSLQSSTRFSRLMTAFC